MTQTFPCQSQVSQESKSAENPACIFSNILVTDIYFSFVPTRRNDALSVETQVLASMRFLASGCFYQVDADVLGIHKSSVCRALKGFCEALVSKSDRFHLRTHEKNENILKFYKMGGGGATHPAFFVWMAFRVGICTAAYR